MSIKLLLLAVGLFAASACKLDADESLEIYEGMQTMGLTPRAGQTVWTRDVTLVLASVLPTSDVYTLVNRRPWRVNTTFYYSSSDSELSLYTVRDFEAFSTDVYSTQPYIFELGITFYSRGQSQPEGRVLMRNEIFQENGPGVVRYFVYEVEFDHQPFAPLPPSIPVIGFGKNFEAFSPDLLTTPTTDTNTAFSLFRDCFSANNNTACTLAQFTSFVQSALISSGFPSSRCQGTPSLDDFDLNDGTRGLNRVLKAQYGEVTIPGKYGPLSFPAQSSATFGVPCGEQTVEAATQRSPILHGQLAAGRALRDRIVADSGVLIDAAADASFPKPIPPIPSRLDFGALLTGEGKRIGIEVGVQRGFNLEALLLTWPTCELMFVLDPWEETRPEYGSSLYQEEVFREASRRLAPYGNVVLLRDYSPGVLKQFPDGFFEYAYVDACHDYGSVLADLLALWPKLAKGAILAGHDYQDNFMRNTGFPDYHVQMDGARHPEARAVKGAVLDFSTMVRRQLTITYEESIYRSWMLRK